MPLILRAGAGALLVAALALWPYAFYQLLRWLICPTAGFLSFRFRKARRPGRSWTWGVIAVLFNPLIPVSLDRIAWNAADIAVASLLVTIGGLDDSRTGRDATRGRDGE